MFTFKEVQSEKLLQESFRFRYKMIQDSKNPFSLINAEELDIDEYDKYSKHFVALDKDNKIIATFRLIIDSPMGYPTPNKMSINMLDDKKNSKDYCEASRIFIEPKYRGIKNTKKIINTFMDMSIPYIKEKNVKYMYAALEKNFLKLLHIFDLNYQIIGEASEYHGIRYPCLLTRDVFIKDNPLFLKKL